LAGSIAHVTSTATGNGDVVYSFVDVCTRQPDGSFLFAFSSWTVK
jgi:hypothetical protein